MTTEGDKPMNFLKRRQGESKVRDEGRLPPGQPLTQKFPGLTYGPHPPFDPQTWDFRVFGEAENEMRWTGDEFLKLPTKPITCDIHCVTRWSKFDTVWEGVAFLDLVEMI